MQLGMFIVYDGSMGGVRYISLRLPNWLVLSDEQMSKRWQFPYQMTSK